jgi:pleiotropic regulator 1
MQGEFLHNTLSNQRAIVNCMALNEDGVMVSGADNGSIWFWDWRSGHCFQQAETQVGSRAAAAAATAAAASCGRCNSAGARVCAL